MASRLEPYDLSGENLELLQECFANPNEIDLLRVCQKRPKPSEVRERILEELSLDSPNQLSETILRSINYTWDSFYEGSVGPNEFMRTLFGASYEIVTIPEKGRGIIASRDIKAGETVLQDTPVIVLPPGLKNVALLLTLPQKALEAIMLLHNAKPEARNYSKVLQDSAILRLMDYLQGVVDTNSFVAMASWGQVGVLLLTGSLFNHSDTPTLLRRWDESIEQVVFTASRDIQEGEELEV